MRHARRPAGVAGVLLVAVVAVSAACGGPSAAASASPTPWTEPQWMTKSRAVTEEGQAKMSACIAASGTGLSMSEDGNVTGKEPPGLDEAGKLARQKLVRDTVKSCSEKAYGPAPTKQPTDRIPEMYRHLFDTKACVEAHGYKVGKPPSEDQWSEDIMKSPNAWSPFGDLKQQIADGKLTMTHEEYVKLFKACPQDGIIITGLA